MAVDFDLTTAAIDIDRDGARTQVTLFTSQSGGNKKFALFDMVRGHSLIEDQITFAFTFNGHVRLKAGFDSN